MRSFKTRVITLSAFQHGEANRIVSYFTEDSGKIKGVAHGARKLKSKFGASNEPATLSEVMFYISKKGSLYTVKESKIINSFVNIKNNLQNLKALFELLNIVEQTTIEAHTEKELFQELIELLRVFDLGMIGISYFSIYSKVIGLKLSGLFPDWQNCIECNKEDGDFFVTSEGLLCSKCIKKSYRSKIRINPSIKKILERINLMKLSAFNSMVITTKQEKDINDILYLLLKEKIVKKVWE